MYACYGILGALYERERTGQGRRIEVNMLEASIAFMPDPFANHVRMGIANDRLTRVSSSHSFAFRCADGKLLAVHLSSQAKFWEAFCGVLEHPELIADERFKTRELRIRNYRELTRVLGDIVVTRPRAEWMTRLEAADVPFAPVQTIPDVIDDPQVRHLHTFYEEEHPTEGKNLGIYRPVLIDGQRDAVQPAPTLGEHTDAVLAELGYGGDEIARLRKASVI
jgi:formyl-CoA transferase